MVDRIPAIVCASVVDISELVTGTSVGSVVVDSVINAVVEASSFVDVSVKNVV